MKNDQRELGSVVARRNLGMHPLPLCSRAPPASRHRHIFRLTLVQNLNVGGKAIQQLPLVSISRADFDFLEGVEYVQFGYYERIEVVDQPRVVYQDCVKPAAPARPTCRGAVFLPELADLL